jgi:hypothetical protein
MKPESEIKKKLETFMEKWKSIKDDHSFSVMQLIDKIELLKWVLEDSV